jgi:Na+/melibiose symporter-like transporter
VIATPIWERVSRRIGKERAFRIASAIFLLASASIVLALWAPGSWIYVSVAIAGVAYAGMQALPMAMLPDVISHDERSSGPGQAGTFTGMWTASETVGFALGTTIVAVVLAITGYVSRTAGDATAIAQPTSAVTGIVLIFSVVPAVLMLLSLATLARYGLRRHDIDGADR